jgi:hypothetical protein
MKFWLLRPKGFNYHYTDTESCYVFPRRRDHDTGANLRSGRTQAFATWADVTGVAMAA